MPLQNIKEANRYIAELRSKASAYREFSKEKIPALFGKDQKERRPPREFVDSSFLYIRSYDGDIGIRPFSGIVFWNSPDITVAPLNDLSAYTQLLDGGKTYQFNCNVRNRGDLVVPSAKVEFFLCNPTLGFDTRFATKLGVTSGWVNPYNTTKVGIQYSIPPDFSGHKCLFARTFSFAPVDLPIDDYQLSPTLDRHVAQLNLDFVAQASAYQFNLVHLPNAMDQIHLVPLKAADLIALRHPFQADFKMSRTGIARLLMNGKVTLLQGERNHTQARIKRSRNTIQFVSKNEKELSLEEQSAITKNLHAVLRKKNEYTGPQSEFREAFRAYRKMNQPMQQSTLEMQIPHLGLAKGEATAFNIVCTNKVTGEIKGGITVIVTG